MNPYKRRPVLISLVLSLFLLLASNAALAAGLTLNVAENAIPGGIIQISGAASGVTPGTSIGISILNPSGGVVFADESQTGDDGSFSFTFTLPDNAPQGLWQAQAAGGGTAASKSFTVGGAAGVIEVSTSNPHPGNPVTIRGKMPQGNVPVGITIKEPGGAVAFADQTLAGSDGNYSFQFTLPADAPTGIWTADVAGDGITGRTSFKVTESSSGGTSSGGGGGGGITANNNVSLSVTASAGGTVSTADNRVSVNVPANSLTGDAVLNIEELQGTDIPTGAFSFGSKVYEINIINGSIKPGSSVKLIFDCDLPGTSEEQINAYYWNGSKWICLGGQMVEGRLEVNVTHFTKFAVMVDPSLPLLSDIRSHWAYQDIKRLVGIKAISGYPDQSFKPENNVTRAEFAVLLARALGWEAGNKTPDFADAADIPAWAGGYIAAAVEKGVINGYEDRTFRAGRQINRSEIAVMLMRASGKQEEPAAVKTLVFSDADEIESWAKDYISLAVEQGILKGKPGNMFAPNDDATRAESSAMIARMLGSLGL